MPINGRNMIALRGNALSYHRRAQHSSDMCRKNTYKDNWIKWKELILAK